MATLKNRNDLQAQAAANLPDNTTQEISPQDVREMAENLAESNFNKISDGPLVGLKPYNTGVIYENGQGVNYSGNLYFANKTTTLGAFVPADWDLFASNVSDLNDLSDVTTGLPGTPTIADDGKILFYNQATNKFITDDAITSGTVVINAKKASSGTIAKGKPVYLVGFDSDLHTVEEANAGAAGTMPVIGFAAEDMDATNLKHVTTFGKLTGLDTSAFSVGADLYISTTTGTLTATRPTGGSTLVQRVATVLKSAASGGQLFIFNTARAAGLPNLDTDYLWLGDANGQPQAVNKNTLGGNSIYTADGTLSGNRIVDLNSNQLSFDGAAGSLIIMKDDGTLELGLGSNAGSKFEVAVGNLANATGVTSIAVGYNSQSTTDFTIAIGRNANATHTRTTIIGAQSSSGGSSATSLGYGVGVGSNGTSIGYISDAGTNAVALGNVSQATGNNSIAIGSKATASGSKSIMISNDGLAVTNNVANSLALSFDQSGHVFFAGLTADSYFNGSGNFGFGTTSPTAKLTIQGNGTSTGITLALYDNDTTPKKTWEWLDNGTMNGSDGSRITNTIINPSVQEVTSSATFTINADQETTGVLTAMAAATTIAAPTGTPVQAQKLVFRFKDDGTARALTFNAIFRAIGITLPTTTTANKLLYIGCMYNSTDTKWDVISVQEEA